MLNQSTAAVQLLGTPSEVPQYKDVDGDRALFFPYGGGSGSINGVDFNLDGFTITFWIKPLSGAAGKWVQVIHCIPQTGASMFFYYKIETTSLVINIQDTRTYQVHYYSLPPEIESNSPSLKLKSSCQWQHNSEIVRAAFARWSAVF
ncbi:hypothetical protein AC249_AIPGENE2980 [Exaiptasia diaphana]|nr:hypothetical protein AC249_AIPGENE2980 [Exaiptasia diaphana]